MIISRVKKAEPFIEVEMSLSFVKAVVNRLQTAGFREYHNTDLATLLGVLKQRVKELEND